MQNKNIDYEQNLLMLGDFSVYATQTMTGAIEYVQDLSLDSDYRCINTAQSIMNRMTFENLTIWYRLHSLTPTYNSEMNWYSLGFWRPLDD